MIFSQVANLLHHPLLTFEFQYEVWKEVKARFLIAGQSCRQTLNAQLDIQILKDI